MNEFKQTLQVNTEVMQRLNDIETYYHQQGRKMNLNNKIATAVYMAIQDVEVENKEEEKEKREYIDLLNKVIGNYEQIKPVILNTLAKNKMDKTISKQMHNEK